MQKERVETKSRVCALDKQQGLLYSIGNYIQYPGINHNRKEYKEDVSMCIIESLLCSRNEHNMVNQLYLNKIYFLKKTACPV